MRSDPPTTTLPYIPPILIPRQETNTHPLHPYPPKNQVPTPYGDVAIEEFDLAKARELDVIFLAVGGDFSKDFAHKLAEGVRLVGWGRCR